MPKQKCVIQLANGAYIKGNGEDKNPTIDIQDARVFRDAHTAWHFMEGNTYLCVDAVVLPVKTVQIGKALPKPLKRGGKLVVPSW